MEFSVKQLFDKVAQDYDVQRKQLSLALMIFME